MMKRIREFIQRERLYVLLLIFIILVNVLIFMADKATPKTKSEVAVPKTAEELFLRQEEAERLLARDKTLALIISLTSFLILTIFFLGLVIDINLLGLKLRKETLDISTHRQEAVAWNIVDVARVVILFLFFGYMIMIIESLLAGTLAWLKHDNLRMMLNSSILDTIGLVFIFYFTVRQYRARLVSLGLTVKNFIRNVFYGIVGYLAAIPVLITTLVVVITVMNILKYVPEKQPVVELFLKEKDPAFLTYTSIFAAVAGPVIEEIFFRAFMYSAVKKYIGVLWATILTAAIFAGLHTNVVGFLPILILGILLAYLYEKTGTLVSSITVHVMHNLSMVYFVLLLKRLQI